jgi:YidC/Oxa1 family membrane protein insertase
MNYLIFIAMLGFGFTPTAQAVETAPHVDSIPVAVKNSKMVLDESPFWVHQWNLNEPKGIDLKAITSFDSALLMTFSGADFTYLNQQKAASLKTVSDSRYEWSFSDANVDYKRTFQSEGDHFLVSVDVQFEQKAPEKAYLNLVSHSPADDKEAQDRELFFYTNTKIERKTVSKSIDPTEILTPVKWFGAGSRYFVLTVIPVTGNPEKLAIQATGEKQAQASLQLPVVNQQLHASFKVAFVPKRLDVLRAIDPSLDTTVDLGFFTVIAYPILLALKFIYRFVGNYGLAIIILTVLIKILTFPLVVKSMKGMRKMAEVQPKMKALQEKYKDDKVALNQEMMQLMKLSGYNPMSGCFPMLLQMPIFFALYRVLYSAEELYGAPFAFWLKDLSAKDPLFITPVLMSILMFLQQKLTPPSPGMDPAQRKMMMFMPLMFGGFMLTTPSGLCVYMLVNALVSVIQQQYLNKKLGVPGNAASMATSF